MPVAPKYRLHRPTGQAVVTIRVGGKRRDVYLGRHGTPESVAEYSRVVAEHAVQPDRTPAISDGGPSVAEVLVAFWRHAERYYRGPDGRPTNEIDNFRLALRPVRELYGHTAAKAFGPLAFKAVRERYLRPASPAGR